METTIMPDANFLKQLEHELKVNVNLCYQCGKCSAGCPMSYAMDYTPLQVIHAIRLGLKDPVLNSKTIWMCSACQTCTTRCPQEVDIARVMDAVRIIAVSEGVKPRISIVHAFNRAALRNIKWFGRMYEIGLIGDLKLRTLEFFKDMKLGLRMFLKGKLKIIPSVSLARTLTTMSIFAKTHGKEKDLKK